MHHPHNRLLLLLLVTRHFCFVKVRLFVFFVCYLHVYRLLLFPNITLFIPWIPFKDLRTSAQKSSIVIQHTLKVMKASTKETIFWMHNHFCIMLPVSGNGWHVGHKVHIFPVLRRIELVVAFFLNLLHKNHRHQSKRSQQKQNILFIIRKTAKYSKLRHYFHVLIWATRGQYLPQESTWNK